MHRDLKLNNIGLNFTNIDIQKRFREDNYLSNFLKNFDFDKD